MHGSRTAGNFGTGECGHLDVDAYGERHASAHGADRLWPDQEANYKGAKYGWQKFIGNLERVVGGLD